MSCRVGLLCGSLGATSSNAALLHNARVAFENAGHTVETIDGLAAIPCFDPALTDDPPTAVADFRRQVRAIDLLVIAAPEYAAGVAGSTKNALDWLVGDSTIYRKLIGVASAGTTGGVFAIEQLVRTISWQGGWVVATLGIAAPKAKSNEQGVYTDPETLAQISDWVAAMDKAISGSLEERRSLISAVVSAYDIDPARFGEIT